MMITALGCEHFSQCICTYYSEKQWTIHSWQQFKKKTLLSWQCILDNASVCEVLVTGSNSNTGFSL